MAKRRRANRNFDGRFDGKNSFEKTGNPMLINSIIILTILYVAIMAGMYFLQRKILYVPDATPAYTKETAMRQVDVLRLQTSDDEQIIGWYHAADEGYPTIVYFHGNAGNLNDRTDKFSTLTSKGFGLLAIDYRGYGGSTGSPTEQGLYTDARAAMQYALQQRSIPENRVLLYGESLGTGVAVKMATEYPSLAGMVLEAPYTSVANRAQEIYWFLPVHMLLRDQFDSLSNIASLNIPLLILHGTADETIPVSHGKTLLDAYTGPKQGVFYDGYGHTDFDLPRIAADVQKFATEHGMIINPVLSAPTAAAPSMPIVTPPDATAAPASKTDSPTSELFRPTQ